MNVCWWVFLSVCSAFSNEMSIVVRSMRYNRVADTSHSRLVLFTTNKSIQYIGTLTRFRWTLCFHFCHLVSFFPFEQIKVGNVRSFWNCVCCVVVYGGFFGFVLCWIVIFGRNWHVAIVWIGFGNKRAQRTTATQFNCFAFIPPDIAMNWISVTAY